MKLYKSICFSFIVHAVEKYYRIVNMYTTRFLQASSESVCGRMAKLSVVGNFLKNQSSKPHSYGQATVISNSPQIYLAPVDRSPKINQLDLSWLNIPDQQNKNFSYKP